MKRIAGQCRSLATQQLRKEAAAPSAAASLSAASRVLKCLDSEIKIQEKVIRETVKDEEIPLEMSRVLAAPQFKTLLGGSGWKVQDVNGSACLEMVRTEGDTTSTLRVDIQEVLRGEDAFEQEEGEEMEEETEEMEEDDSDAVDMDDESTPQSGGFPVEIEIRRASQPGTYMLVDCMAQFGEEGSELIVDQVTLCPATQQPHASAGMSTESRPYIAPDYSTLDETLRDSIEEFINEKFVAGDKGMLVELVSAVAHAKEAKEYLAWLQRLRGMVAA